MQPFLHMKSESDLDINDGAKVFGFEQSKVGSVTQFMSPANIRKLLCKEGRRSNRIFIKCGSGGYSHLWRSG